MINSNNKTQYQKFISSTVDFHNLQHATDIANDLGLGIEISRFGKLSELDFNYVTTLKNYKNLLADFDGNISLHGFFSNLSIASKDNAIRQISIKRYYQSLEIAQTLGAKTVVFHTCKNNLLKHKEFNHLFFQKNVEFFKEFITEFEKEGIVAVLENVHEPSPEFIRDVLAAVNMSNFKACIDVGHVNLHSEISPSDWIKEYGIMLHHMHIHNNFKDEDSHSSLLSGNVNLIDIFKTLSAMHIKPSVTFEIFDENSLRESVKYFEEVLEKL